MLVIHFFLPFAIAPSSFPFISVSIYLFSKRRKRTDDRVANLISPCSLFPSPLDDECAIKDIAMSCSSQRANVVSRERGLLSPLSPELTPPFRSVIQVDVVCYCVAIWHGELFTGLSFIAHPFVALLKSSCKRRRRRRRRRRKSSRSQREGVVSVLAHMSLLYLITCTPQHRHQSLWLQPQK